VLASQGHSRGGSTKATSSSTPLRSRADHGVASEHNTIQCCLSRPPARRRRHSMHAAAHAQRSAAGLHATRHAPPHARHNRPRWRCASTWAEHAGLRAGSPPRQAVRPALVRHIQRRHIHAVPATATNTDDTGWVEARPLQATHIQPPRCTPPRSYVPRDTLRSLRSYTPLPRRFRRPGRCNVTPHAANAGPAAAATRPAKHWQGSARPAHRR
jgi:hypothetical protein